MIYKCNNCGRNYNLKPEYCECGNNSFQEVVQNFDYSSVKTDFNVGQDVDFLYGNNNSSFENSQNFDSDDTLSSDNDLKKQRNSEILAIIIFIIVLLSAIIMIFSNFSALLNKPKDKTVSVEIEKYIPSDVNEYWVEETPVSVNNTNDTNSVNAPKKTVSNESKTKTTQKTISKKTKIPEKNIASTKNDTKLVPQKNNAKNVKQQSAVAKVVSKNETMKAENAQQTKENTISVEEYLKYKNSLRNKLFANFPILTVQGQGISRVSFSISSDGKLLNRKFVSQSGNKSLDDAMYNMLMRVPAYYPPPSGYNGSEIVMQMEFNNGHYSFSYLN